MTQKVKILISACLLGQDVRYDGKNQSDKISKDDLSFLQTHFSIFTLCPEVAGGLSTPRMPAEEKDGKIITTDGQDVSTEFAQGAAIAAELCTKEDIRIALLKESSPSCGSSTVYDGSHTGTKVSGQGLTTAKLRSLGISVFSEETFAKLKQHFFNLKNT